MECHGQRVSDAGPHGEPWFYLMISQQDSQNKT
jgi:hypothetical protein